jgi:hypothetical protein
MGHSNTYTGLFMLKLYCKGYDVLQFVGEMDYMKTKEESSFNNRYPYTVIRGVATMKTTI